jgi:hypothetical protein
VSDIQSPALRKLDHSRSLKRVFLITVCEPLHTVQKKKAERFSALKAEGGVKQVIASLE